LPVRSIADWIDYCRRRLEDAGLFYGHGTDNPLDEAAWLVLHVAGRPVDGSFADWNAPLEDMLGQRIEDLLEQRCGERRPLAYLLGEAWFCGLRFEVTPDVLIPRSPFAELIQAEFAPWVEAGRLHRVLDLCTGSACIAIAIAHYLPQAQVDAADISAQALEVARRNVQAHGVGGRVRLVQSDLFSALAGCRYDLLVSNPPYVADWEWRALPEEYHWEPRMALETGMDGLELVLRILAEAPDHLEEQGVLICEVGEAQERMTQLLPELPLTWLEFEHGGGGVFTISRDELSGAAGQVRSLLAGA